MRDSTRMLSSSPWCAYSIHVCRMKHLSQNTRNSQYLSSEVRSQPTVISLAAAGESREASRLPAAERWAPTRGCWGGIACHAGQALHTHAQDRNLAGWGSSVPLAPAMAQATLDWRSKREQALPRRVKEVLFDDSDSKDSSIFLREL